MERRNLKAAFVVFGGLINWLIRGGGIKVVFPRMKHGKIINAIAFGIAAYITTKDPIFAAGMLGCMSLGQSFPIYPDAMDTAVKAKRWLDAAQIATGRGVFFALPMSTLIYFMQPQAILWTLPALFGMAVAYGVAHAFFWELPELETEWLNKWTVSEILYGLLLWLPFCALI